MSDTLQDRLRKLSTENPGPRDCIDEAADKIDELTNNEREYSRLIGMSYQECRDLLDTQSKRIAELESAITKTLNENGHLADGDNCTLVDLKRVMGVNI